IKIGDGLYAKDKTQAVLPARRISRDLRRPGSIAASRRSIGYIRRRVRHIRRGDRPLPHLKKEDMKFAKALFLIAGIYGLLVLAPQYFLEEKNGRDFPPVITHPEYYYGFVGVAIAWQIVFLILSRDPVRYRPIMLAAVVEKASYAIATMILYLKGRTGP